MYFVFYCEDVPDSLDARLATREAHLNNLMELVNAGRVMLAGPMPKEAGGNPAEVGFDGSMIVADFESQQAAEEWINNDPYVTAGVFQNITIRPFVKVFPQE
ncbi:MAG: YciI family protein [Gammaproteobacteria bacterium]